MQSTDTTKIASIAQRIKLASLTTGAWRATRLNRKETQKVNDDHGTTDAAKVHVRLTDSAALHELNKLHAAAYDAHSKLTLPAAQAGFRLLPAGREFEHADRMRAFADQHRTLKAQFLAEYDAEKASAPVRLNGLYDAKQWPDVSVIAGKFQFGTQYLACPTDPTWSEWITESARAAEDELRERLEECLQRVVDNCGKDKGKIYDSLFANLQELIGLAPDFNFTDSPAIAHAAQAAREIAGMNADTVRDSKTARKEAAQKASAILAALGAQ